MKYKDYYQTLGLSRDATIGDIKKSYRKLAHLYHPDVSKDPAGEEKFKEAAEAYATLKNPEKRAEYDALGSRPSGESFTPPPQWQKQYGTDGSSFDDVDLADLFKAFRPGAGGYSRDTGHRHPSIAGDDFTVNVPVTLENIFKGGETDISVTIPEYDANGLPHRVPKIFRVTIPKGAKEGLRMRLPGRGGPGQNGGAHGDLYVVLSYAPHATYRVAGRDVSFDLLLAPWEAALGATIPVTTMGGAIDLTIPQCTSSGQRLRISGRGLPAGSDPAGDLYAVVRIVVPKKIDADARLLYEQLAKASHFDARSIQ